MANFIIKAASTDDLLLQNDGGTTIVSIPGSGNPSIADDAGNVIATFETNTINLGDKTLQRPLIRDYSETENAIGLTGGGTKDIDLTLGNVHSATVNTGESTFTFSNPIATGNCSSFTLILTNGASQTVNWPPAVDWAGGAAPILTAAGIDILTFTTIDGGTIWYGFMAGTDMK